MPEVRNRSRIGAVIRATSSDGRWSFEEGRLRSGTVEADVFTIDFFERWTFARFLPGGELALAFESSQPWSEFGSYGDRYGGVQVLAPGPDAGRWALVAIEFDYRRHDESFVPFDVVWHRRGLLAWLHEGTLSVQVLASPRGEIVPDLLPPRDSDQPMLFSFDRWGSWRSLAVDPDGRYLRAFDDAGHDVFDLELRCRARDGGGWEPLDVWTP
ncbi:MAG: hypothetical protein QM820_44975 [Minicystis sp.]